MMKKASVLVGFVAIFALLLCGTSMAVEGTAEIVSRAGVEAAGVDAYGPLQGTEMPTDVDWGDPSDAVALSSVDSAWSVGGDLGDAVWITTSTAADPTSQNYSKFSDSYIPPCTATSLSGTIFTSANTAVDVSLNGSPISTVPGSATVVSEYSFGPVTPIEDGNTLDFLVTTDGTAGTPVGLIYKAAFTFDYTPFDVLWQPPIVKTGRAIVKYGTTLPIKFRLQNESGLIRTRQNVILTIKGSDDSIVDKFSGSSLKFARGNGQYQANFQTKRYNLKPEVEYTVSVNDGCSSEDFSLGTPIKMQIQGKTTKGKK